MGAEATAAPATAAFLASCQITFTHPPARSDDAFSSPFSTGSPEMETISVAI